MKNIQVVTKNIPIKGTNEIVQVSYIPRPKGEFHKKK